MKYNFDKLNYEAILPALMRHYKGNYNKSAWKVSHRCVNPNHLDKNPSAWTSLNTGIYHCNCEFNGKNTLEIAEFMGINTEDYINSYNYNKKKDFSNCRPVLWF